MRDDHPGDRSQPDADLYLLDELLGPEELEVRERVRRFAERAVLPVINDHWERAEFPFELLPALAELRVAGGSIRGHGCPGMSPLAAAWWRWSSPAPTGA